jgi:hypothetical protein
MHGAYHQVPRLGGIKDHAHCFRMPHLGHNEKMASMRTSLAIQRSRMAERTLMASMRTSLSLIGFGFTIFSFFQAVSDPDRSTSIFPPRAPARERSALLKDDLERLVVEAKRLSLDLDALLRAVEEHWERLSAEKTLVTLTNTDGSTFSSFCSKRRT